MMRVSINDRKVVVRWGPHPEQMRMSQQHFDSPDDARQEYFGRLARCAEQGFIDASQAESV
jgi:predicted DNA-binding WGR domain protein